MISSMTKRIFTRDGITQLLTLIALCCLPVALSTTVRDAALSLFLPITLFGAMFTWELAKTSINQVWLRIIILIICPIALFLRVGHLGASLFRVLGQLLLLLSTVPTGFIQMQLP
jgi:hypothetical protein